MSQLSEIDAIRLVMTKPEVKRAALKPLLDFLDQSARELGAHAKRYKLKNDAFEASLRDRNGGQLPPVLSSTAKWPFERENGK